MYVCIHVKLRTRSFRIESPSLRGVSAGHAGRCCVCGLLPQSSVLPPCGLFSCPGLPANSRAELPITSASDGAAARELNGDKQPIGTK